MSPIDVISDTSLRENLAKVMDEVCDAGSYVVVTRQNARPVVIMSLAEFRSWEETIHLLRSPANAARLMDSIAELETGKGIQHELVNLDPTPRTRKAVAR
ncbi:MAG: type II toxin-antitoxin system Phd/YefM family antitoxin [Microvirga sp.]